MNKAVIKVKYSPRRNMRQLCGIVYNNKEFESSKLIMVCDCEAL